MARSWRNEKQPSKICEAIFAIIVEEEEEYVRIPISEQPTGCRRDKLLLFQNMLGYLRSLILIIEEGTEYVRMPRI